MVIPIRTGLAAGFAAALALAIPSARHPAPAPHDPSNPLLAAPPPNAPPSAAYAGCVALAVGGLGLLARLRRR